MRFAEIKNSESPSAGRLRHKRYLIPILVRRFNLHGMVRIVGTVTGISEIRGLNRED